MRHQAAVAPQPRERPFDHPAAAHDLEATFLVGALDDLEIDGFASERCCELGSGVAAIGEDLRDPREQPACLADEIGGAIAILNIGRDHLNAEQKTYRVNERVAFDALGFLPGIIADRILAGPPFSVAFATCVSMIAAVGDASRPSASRHLASNS